MSGRPILSNEEIEETPITPRKLMSQKNSKATAAMTAMGTGEKFSEKRNATHLERH
jgi:hypothetical protein